LKKEIGVEPLDKQFYEGAAEACEVVHWFLINKRSLDLAFFFMKIVYSILLADSILSRDEVAKETAGALLPYLNHGMKQTPKGTLLVVNGKELHPRDYAEEVAKIIDNYRDHIVEKHDVRPRFIKEMLG
jgi:uncharacterized protein YlzI (FlbEa/FlbD family)